MGLAPGQFVSAMIADRAWANGTDSATRLAIAQAIGSQCAPWHGFLEQFHCHLMEFHNRAHPEILRRLAFYEHEAQRQHVLCRSLQSRIEQLERAAAAPAAPPPPSPTPRARSPAVSHSELLGAIRMAQNSARRARSHSVEPAWVPPLDSPALPPCRPPHPRGLPLIAFT